MKKIAIVFGTRPDTIKLAPVIRELKKYPEAFSVCAIATAQHRQMLDQVLEIFDIIPDYDLDIMKPAQSLATITKKTIEALDGIMVKEKPDMMLIQGDTSTTFIGSLAAFYRHIPVGHIEAGLRTHDRKNPFPEEVNRRLTSCLCDLHFAPTLTAKEALLKENIPPDSIFITGNTIIDSLNLITARNRGFSRKELQSIITQKKKIVLLTMHRRENWGEPILNACKAISRLAAAHPDMNFIFPVHLNPIVREIAYNSLHSRENIYLTEPLDYADFVNLMAKAHLIITDSGGIQEEGPHFGVPILVLRSVTERPEAVEAGTVKLVGTNEEKIFNFAAKLINNPAAYNRMAEAVNPYGDGKAADRIVRLIKRYFGMKIRLSPEFNSCTIRKNSK